ncbi:hematopoietic cell signal transducer [Hyperolius riggenbachi]|uniref:hematopoietic cell signal transducer n=1 Tax=Hyperolius riggenbachi TaxID=752182 RepID=UPI0035A2EE44
MMSSMKFLLQGFLLWLCLGLTASSETEPSCGDCYRIDTVTLVGVVIGDIFLTVVIILVVYYCTKQTFQRKSPEDDKKVYMNMPVR